MKSEAGRRERTSARMSCCKAINNSGLKTRRFTLVVSVFLLMVLNPEVVKTSQCPESFHQSVNCSCTQLGARNYELLCPQSQYPHNSYILMANIQQNEHVNLLCTVAKSPADLMLVSGLLVGPVKRFSIKLCPLPDVSFREFMLGMGISRIQQLQIQSAANFSTLQKKHLEGLYEVTQMDLSSSGLTTLPEDLFNDMSNLTWLHLNNNNVNLPKGIFKFLPKLDVLDLGNNNLTHLEPGLFRNLTHLRLLNLWGNKLTNLTRTVFSDIPNLESLDLHSNTIVTLRPDLFIDLGKLKNLNLFGNEFSSLPPGLLTGNPLLERIQLHNNRKTLRMIPSGFFSNLTSLKEIHLHNCNLSSVPKDLFWGSTSVTDILLNINSLTELPAELFQDNKELLNIDISYNKLSTLPNSIFSTTVKLKKLKAHHNQLTHISTELLLNLGELKELDLSSNRLVKIYNDALSGNKKLNTIMLSNNFLNLYDSNDPESVIISDEFGHRSPFHHCLEIKELHLANNSITEIFHDWLSLNNLTTLDLRNNKISYLEANDLHFRSMKYVTVDLSYNNISVIDLQLMELLALAQYESNSSTSHHYKTLENHSARINLIGNPLLCDCRNYHLKRFFEGTLTPEVYYLIDINSNNLTCSGPKQLEGLYWNMVPSKLLTCELSQIINESSTICPKECKCFYRPQDEGLIIDCTELRIKTLPQNFLLGTLQFYTKSYKNVNHTELYLTRNYLSSLPLKLDEGFKYVTTLSLSSNNISQITLTGLSPNITILELDHNNMTYLEADSIKFLSNAHQLQRISLYNNPWACDCQSKDFLSFIQKHFEKIDNLNNVTCLGGKSISELTVNEICPTSTSGVIIISIVIALLGLILGLLIALYYRYNHEIKVWLYAHQMFLWFVTEDELDRDKLYDAFISYSHQDEDFVIKHLVPGLENGTPKFKLCLHYRDWIIGDYIPSQIARSVEDSRRTIVVLSPNFLESVWGKMEFRTAHSQALNEGRARVIVILYGDVGPADNLDPELKAYVSMNTYLKWGDPWFWDKLRFALPHPPNLSKGIPLFQRNLTRQQNKPVLSIDKDDLIKGSDPNSSPPATTTPPANSFIDQTPSFKQNGQPKSAEIISQCA